MMMKYNNETTLCIQQFKLKQMKKDKKKNANLISNIAISFDFILNKINGTMELISLKFAIILTFKRKFDLCLHLFFLLNGLKTLIGKPYWHTFFIVVNISDILKREVSLAIIIV